MNSPASAAPPASTPAASTYTIGGTATTSMGSLALKLQNNGTDNLTLSSAGAFTFTTALAAGASYNVTLATHSPGQACTVSNGTGTVAGANVTNIGVACVPGTESVLYSFAGGADGANPYFSNLIQGVDGNLYGMTVSGGGHNFGTVFKITTAGVETVLHSFAGGADGQNPFGSLIQGVDGNLYGMTYSGGTNSAGTVFKITTAGVESVLYSFAGGADGQNPYGTLIQGVDGNLYGMTAYGGTNSAGTVFKITTAGVESVLHSFAGGTADGQSPFGSLIQGVDGNLYGMTEGGGTNSVGTVFSVTTAGVESVLYSFAGGADGQGPYGSLIQGVDGNLYGMTYDGGANSVGTVFMIN
ncbi:MAG: choice-of-anchor tandem repeat GloVer-containing protein [Devosia sp.]